METKITELFFERRYSDDSGTEFGVGIKKGDICFQHIDKTFFPIEELDWLISSLEFVRDSLKAIQPPSPEGV